MNVSLSMCGCRDVCVGGWRERWKRKRVSDAGREWWGRGHQSRSTVIKQQIRNMRKLIVDSDWDIEEMGRYSVVRGQTVALPRNTVHISNGKWVVSTRVALVALN
jgi:hypothetical protein